jgi:hypothetical protein
MKRQQSEQRQQQMIVVAQWGNLNRWTYLHQVAKLFRLTERTNHGRVWLEPLLSISTCLQTNTIDHFMKNQHLLNITCMLSNVINSPKLDGPLQSVYPKNYYFSIRGELIVQCQYQFVITLIYTNNQLIIGSQYEDSAISNTLSACISEIKQRIEKMKIREPNIYRQASRKKHSLDHSKWRPIMVRWNMISGMI